MSQPAAAPTAANDTDSDSDLEVLSVGCDVEVFWDGDSAWFGGVVVAVRAESPRYLVRYEDDEVYWEPGTPDWIR